MRTARFGKKAALIALTVLLCAGITAVVLIVRAPQEEPASRSPLGMLLIDIADKETASSYHVEECGVYVLAVDENSQAYDAGVRSGDRIVSINGMRVGSTSELEDVQRRFPPHTMIRVDFAPHSQDRVFSTDLLWNGERAVQ